ncbi:MAG: hypothetical protein CMF46_02720 [Legionellales bacterium]|nr:hypothetical protein [Legionellales bacterium]|tara:strand:- start:416 stop:967 length:552 start_codon:yes stop_codon:yes gene_type:complete
MIHFKPYQTLLIICLLISCTPTPEQDWSSDYLNIKGSLQWTDTNDQPQQHSFSWKQTGDTIKLVIPMYGGLAYQVIYANNEYASMSGLYNQTFQSLSELSGYFFGSPLPHPDIQFWILGQLPPDHQANNLTYQNNHIQSFSQAGLTITFSDFDYRFEPARPKHIQVTTTQGNLVIKVTEWSDI